LSIKLNFLLERLKVLSDPNKRKQYDMFGSASGAAGGPSGGPGGPSGPGFGGFQYQSQVDPEELFRTIFGDAFKSGRDFESFFDGRDNESQSQYEATQVILYRF
jgi:DnaJ homolog subfamily A member 3